MKEVASLAPEIVWRIFSEISAVPRPSGNEGPAMEMLERWAAAHGFSTRRDRIGNLLVGIPASPGKEALPPVLLQGHIDMVCEKNASTKHDFMTDPIRLVVDGDWVRADGTTLGADNGIGVALALAVGLDETATRPPVEVLVTVDEERGLTGASHIEPGFFRAKRMINLDSESDTGFYIGCAGGMDTILRMRAERSPVPKGWKRARVSMSGLRGGHSGVDIHLNRGNAVKILARGLGEAMGNIPFRLVSIQGGSKRNALPREADAEVVAPGSDIQRLQQAVAQIVSRIEKEELAGIETGVALAFAGTVTDEDAFTEEETSRIIDLLLAIPHGVTAMSQAMPDLVESSTNLGVVTTVHDMIQIVCCSRSSVMSALDGLARQHRSLGMLAGAEAEHSDGYPGWKPNPSSPLLAVAMECYRELFRAEPKLEAIHAGLECGLLTEKYPDLDMVSMGPRIEDAHSPNERVSIPSVLKSWELLRAVLRKLA